LKNHYDFSFSGLKTSVLRYIQQKYGPEKKIPESDLPDITASFQNAVIRALIHNAERALKEYDVKSVSLAGGVAANKVLRNALGELAAKYKKKYVVPDFVYCGDNAAMIAYRGYKIYQSGKRFNYDFNAFPGLLPGTFKVK
ncbi:MAG: carbamoyltransferase N-terminal domain-containing protein, partial [Bacteroidota bacterium]|nr:carbamoyltransferase N-terminal domain-containing protein [Bacteroidota bacterium]